MGVRAGPAEAGTGAGRARVLPSVRRDSTLLRSQVLSETWFPVSGSRATFSGKPRDPAPTGSDPPGVWG